MNDVEEQIITEADFLSNFLDNLDPPLREMTVEQLRGLVEIAPIALRRMLLALIEFKEKGRLMISTVNRLARVASGDWAEHAERMLIDYFWGLLIGAPMRDQARQQLLAWASAAPIPAAGWTLTEILHDQQNAPPPPPLKKPRGPGM